MIDSVIINGSRDSSIGMAARLRTGRPRDLGLISSWARDFTLLHSVQTGPGVQPVSYLICTGGCSPGVKRQGVEADHSSPFSVEIKNDVAVPPFFHTSSWRGA
jgi:hypothetical protein